MVTPSDFAVVTWLIWTLLIAIVGESVKLLSLCLDPMSINSVFVIFRVIACLLSASCGHFLNPDSDRTEYFLH